MFEIDRNGDLIETKISSVSARFIHLVDVLAPAPAAAPALRSRGLLLSVVALLAVGGLALVRRKKIRT